MLTDIVTVLLHPKLLDELFIPQPVATHTVIRQLLQDISTTSIMKLDEYSMSKLWDLMTMIYKWQLSMTTNQNIFDISRRHLRCVSKLLPEYFSRFFIEEALKKFESLRQQFNDDDYKSLCNTLILWFSEYHTKISVLLRLGLQKKDGTFSLPSTLNPKILKNLGENIYRYDNKKNSVEEYENRCADTHEINCLLAPIENNAAKKCVIEIQLPFEVDKTNTGKKLIKINKNIKFENISTINVQNKDFDLSYSVNIPKSTQQDLLEMLDNTSL